MKKIIVILALSLSAALAQANKKTTGKPAAKPETPALQNATEVQPSQPPSDPVTAEPDRGLRSARVAVMAHGAYNKSSTQFGYFYLDTTGPLQKKLVVTPEREVTAVGGGLNLLALVPFASIFYGGFDAGLSFLSVTKYSKPAYTDVSQFQGYLYADGILGISLTESFGIYGGAGAQIYYISPLSVGGTKNDPSFSTTTMLGVNATAGVHLMLGRVIINPSVLLDLAVFGVPSNNTVYQADPYGIKKSGDMIIARLGIGYAFK